MVFKTILSIICGLYRFYPVLPSGKTDCFTQFYPILPNWFYPLGKSTMPTLGMIMTFSHLWDTNPTEIIWVKSIANDLQRQFKLLEK